jgi:hypothetical protein
MSTGATITVTGGLHAGASVLLSESADLVIGSGADANLVLVDEGIAARHATLSLKGKLLTLTAHHEGVRVFGHALAAGRTTVLRPGASFRIGDAQIQFGGDDLLTPDVVRSAEFAWLFAHAPLDYLAKRWALTPRGVKLILLVALMSVVAGALWQAYGPRDAARQPPKLDGPFRFVTMHEDPKTHASVYEGYVSTAGDLASLAALVRADTCASVMRVIVVDQIKEQLADFLSRYYRGAQLRAAAPGTFNVIPPAEDGYLLPESWDYARVARAARESINGLRELAFEGEVTGSGPVRAPLGSIGMNLVRSVHGSWLVDARGVRYFPGAQLPAGKLTRIADCTVTIVRDDDATPYEFVAHGCGESGRSSR